VFKRGETTERNHCCSQSADFWEKHLDQFNWLWNLRIVGQRNGFQMLMLDLIDKVGKYQYSKYWIHWEKRKGVSGIEWIDKPSKKVRFLRIDMIPSFRPFTTGQVAVKKLRSSLWSWTISFQ
jgi:hypothetical protein